VAAGEVAVTIGAAVAALGSVILLGATVYTAAKGQKTPIDVADEFYGTHFGDIAGWVTGKYRKSSPPAPVKTTQTTVASKRNDAAERRAFRQWAVQRILDGCKGAEHPLRKVLDALGRPHSAADRFSQESLWDAGHVRSHKSGGREMSMEDSLFNRSDSSDEKLGVIFEKPAIDICGVPVERNTAKRWESHGLIPKGTVANAPPSPGWLPALTIIPAAPPPPITMPPAR
jgi:hypothetical protein